MKLSLVGTGIRKRLSSRRGQNTVEYLMMLMVVIAVVVLVGVGLKKMMPGIFNSITAAITGATSSINTPGN